MCEATGPQTDPNGNTVCGIHMCKKVFNYYDKEFADKPLTVQTLMKSDVARKMRFIAVLTNLGAGCHDVPC